MIWWVITCYSPRLQAWFTPTGGLVLTTLPICRWLGMDVTRRWKMEEITEMFTSFLGYFPRYFINNVGIASFFQLKKMLMILWYTTMKHRRFPNLPAHWRAISSKHFWDEWDHMRKLGIWVASRRVFQHRILPLCIQRTSQKRWYRSYGKSDPQGQFATPVAGVFGEPWETSSFHRVATSNRKNILQLSVGPMVTEAEKGTLP